MLGRLSFIISPVLRMNLILYKSSSPLSNTSPIIILSTKLLNISPLNFVSPGYSFKILTILPTCSNFCFLVSFKSWLEISLFSNSLIWAVISSSLLSNISFDILLSNFKSIKLESRFWSLDISSLILFYHLQ